MIDQGAPLNQTTPRQDRVAWVREKIPPDFGFCKKAKYHEKTLSQIGT